MSKLQIKLSSTVHGTLQQDVAEMVMKIGECNLFDLLKVFPGIKLASIQRALDFNKFKGYLRVVSRNMTIRVPLSGDLRSLTQYASTTILQLKTGENMLKTQSKDIQKQSFVTRSSNHIEKYAQAAICRRSNLEMVWPNVMNVVIDDDDAQEETVH